MRLFAWGQSDVGRRRDHNEDSLLIAPELQLFAVADGMGGHQAGERASRMAVEQLAEEIRRSQSGDSTAPIGPNGDAVSLQSAATRAGMAIFDAGQADPTLAGMGTTLTAVMIHDDHAAIAHVGDSRCYLYRGTQCQLMTEDHSWVNEQLRAGFLTQEQARDSKFRHVITRSVGYERIVRVDSRSVEVSAGDCLLLCTDGLSNYIDGQEIARLMTAGFYRDVPATLIGLANDRGGEDNISVVLIYLANDDGTGG